MRSFLVILPFCEQDATLAQSLLSWIHSLDGSLQYPILLLSGGKAPSVIAHQLNTIAKEVFVEVFEASCPPLDVEQWPRGPNAMFAHSCKLVHSVFGMPFLWMEPDCVPLKSGWLEAISTEYAACGKLFMGNVRSQTDPNLPSTYLPGCSVYPANAWNLLSKSLNNLHVAWDVSTASVTVPEAHDSELFFEFWGQKGLPPTFQMVANGGAAKNVLLPSQIPSKAVFFHRNKDGSLIRLLSKVHIERGVPKPITIPKSPQLDMIAHVDMQSGYGTYSVSVCQEMIKRGYRLRIFTPSWHPGIGPIPEEIKSRLVRGDQVSNKKFILYPCVFQPTVLKIGGAMVGYMTMWESTRLVSKVDKSMTEAVNALSNCRVVMVPCSWNATIFSAQGVDTPIRIVPLGIDTEFFHPVENNVDGRLVFGTAAKTVFGGVRKGFNTVVDAFRKAFPKEQDVVLRVKSFSDDPEINSFNDPRIERTPRYLSAEALRDWYASINLFVSGSCSEGWGKHQQESMAMGRPVIGVNFGGVTEFFNEDNGYACDWKLIPAEGIYRTMGHYARPSIDSMAEQMRKAYQDRNLLRHKIDLSIASASRFTIAHSVDKIESALTEFSIL